MVDEPDPFHRYLTSCGIETKRTWSYFHDDMLHSAFPFESWLKTHVISLPIHHQLGEEDMMYIVECLERWRERGAVPPGSRRRP
jgi:dTDP-4-amino-4,6-dideoxygalactose transaminase